MKAREDILHSIRSALGGGEAAPARARTVEDRLARPRPNVVPARGARPPAARAALFVEMAEAAAATVARVSDWAAVPAAVREYLDAHDLPRRARVAPALKHLDWRDMASGFGPAEAGDAVGVSRAHAGVAETGTLVLLSGTETPTTLNFLVDVQVVALAAADIVGSYEAVWESLRAAGRAVPRTINLVTGPSRTADIEQTLMLGAHGPRRLHIVVVDAAP